MLKRCVIAAVASLCLGTVLRADEPTFEQRAQAKRISRDIDQAAALLSQAEVNRAAGYWLRAHQRITELLATADPSQTGILSADIVRMTTLRGSILEKGATLPALPELKPVEPATTLVTKATEMDSAEGMAFASAIAPMLVQKCGRCHIDARRGRFSMETIEALSRKPAMIVAGEPDESELFTIIESGVMPKGRNKVTAEELLQLRQWIQSGASFGNADTVKNLKQLTAKNAAAQPASIAEKPVAAPGEKEVVSFSNHVAPNLLESCAACHIDAQNVRGGLNLATFESIVRGGDSGVAIRANQGEESLLVKKLRGTGGGQQMPAGSAPLDEETIQAIARWIDQGAKFDGGNPNSNLRDIVARMATAKATHEELSIQRAERASANWQLVMGGKEAVVHESENFVVLAPNEESKLNEFAELAESVANRVASQLRATAKEPLVKGKIAAYLFLVRYDYGEFGKMIEQRDLPSQWSNHWGNNQVDAYIVFQAQPGDYQQLKPWLARNITAAYVKGLASDVPDWFANGLGYSIAAKISSSDDVVKLWTQKSAELTKKIVNRDDFINGRLTDDDAGLVGFQFVEYLRQAGGDKRLNKMINELRDGSNFERAFVQAFETTPAEMLKTQ